MDSKDFARMMAESIRKKGLGHNWTFDDEKQLIDMQELTGLKLEDIIEISIVPLQSNYDSHTSVEFVCFALMQMIKEKKIPENKYVSTVCFCLEQLKALNNDSEYLWGWVVEKGGLSPDLALKGIKMVYQRAVVRNS